MRGWRLIHRLRGADMNRRDLFRALLAVPAAVVVAKVAKEPEAKVGRIATISYADASRAYATYGNFNEAETVWYELQTSQTSSEVSLPTVHKWQVGKLPQKRYWPTSSVCGG